MLRTPRTTAAAATGSALLVLTLVAGLALTAPGAAAAPRDKTNSGAVTADGAFDRFVVHFAPEAPAATDDAAADAEVAAVAQGFGNRLTVTRRLSTAGVLVQVDERLRKDKADRLIARFIERSAVEFAEVDAVMNPTLTPTDVEYARQWHYSEALAGMNLPAAWDTADGTGVTVAVLDTGITAHSDLAPNVVGGYDFVTSATSARDGNGRDVDAADQGDWTTAGQCGAGSPARNSSWHGTHVAGTIAAATNNASGVSGVAFGSRIQPVRVLAACGGTLADIADAITWASGGTVAGVPANATPSKVINMSLGGSGTCGATYQNAIDAAVARGTTVVVAAGNSNADASGFQPASCTSTVVVAAGYREGNRAQYSNFGPLVDLTAPGGETAVQANGVLSTLNTGTTTPGAEGYAYYQGTSMATPHVAGLAALVLGEGSRTPAQVEAALKAGARALPGTCSGGCGAGLADATRTISALTVTPSPSPTPAPGPSAPLPAATLFTNGTDVAIRDRVTVESPITVTGRTGAAPAALKVPVTIRHTFRGDLQIDLVAPDGSLYRLKSTSSSDSADDVVGTYTVNASSETANGTWRLRVFDRYNGDTGLLDTWSLQF